MQDISSTRTERGTLYYRLGLPFSVRLRRRHAVLRLGEITESKFGAPGAPGLGSISPSFSRVGRWGRSDQISDKQDEGWCALPPRSCSQVIAIFR